MEQITGQAVLQQLWAIARARATDYMAVEGGVLTVADTASLTESQAAAIASIEKAPGGIKVKFYDKLRALELLGKYLGLFDAAASRQTQDNNLLEAIVAAAGKEVQTHDLPELQQAPAAGHDLVGQAEAVQV